MRRRKYNLPIYIVLAVIVCLVVFIAYQAYPTIKDRIASQKGAVSSVSDSQSEDGSEQSADSGSEQTGDETEREDTPESDFEQESEPDVSESDTAANDDSFEDFFSDALFIGDSRTMGLKNYAGLEKSSYFATTGMSVFNISRETVDVNGSGAVSLVEHLEKVRYGKIYLMLGVNELGYDMNAVFCKYKELLGTIVELQPDATVYIEANLHVVKSKSDTSKIYNNPNIDKINSMISELADNKKIFYIDVNPLFDDGGGNLSEEYAYDDTHVLGKYYEVWGQWIKTETAKK